MAKRALVENECAKLEACAADLEALGKAQSSSLLESARRQRDEAAERVDSLIKANGGANAVLAGDEIRAIRQQAIVGTA